MKRKNRVFAAVAAVLALSILLCTAASAGFEEYPDGAGHWAEASLRRAVEEGLLTGMDGRLAPDSTATLPQLLTILSRCFKPSGAAQAEDIGLEGENWYNESVLQAATLGLDFDVEKLDRGELTRGMAFLTLADAFRLIPASPDYTVLDGFSDKLELTGRERDAVAALVSLGIVKGNADKTIRPNRVLTRAELVTIIFRIIDAIVPAAPEEAPAGGVLITESGDLAGRTFPGGVWLGASVKDIDLSGVKAKTVVTLSQVCDIKTDGETDIGRLVIAGGASKRLTIAEGRIGTLAVAVGAPERITVSCQVENAEVTAEGVTVTVTKPLRSLTVSGTGCQVTASGAADTVTVQGGDNTVTLSGKAKTLTVGGANNRVTGAGRSDDTLITSRSSTCYISSRSQTRKYGTFSDMDIDLDVPKFLPAGETLEATLTLKNPVSVSLNVAWLVDGTVVETQPVELSARRETTLTLKQAVDYGKAKSLTKSVSVTLTPGGDGEAPLTVGNTTVLDAVGAALKEAVIQGFTAQWDETSGTIKVSAQVSNPTALPCTAAIFQDGIQGASVPVSVGPEPVPVTLEGPPVSFSASGESGVELRLIFTCAGRKGYASSEKLTIKVGYSAQQALATVSNVYAGDFTLEWALNNDYDRAMKVAWVNAKGYASQTRYLIWVNRAYQRVNVFDGSAGSWTLIHEFLCGTGKPGSPTPVGEYTVWSYDKGWYHYDYWCEPVVRFKTGSGYAFHSRLWKPGHQTLQDDRIGFPVSAGCVRMYDEDVQWLYDNIPIGTTVVVF